MGQIKNIKLHIVTDIKQLINESSHSHEPSLQNHLLHPPQNPCCACDVITACDVTTSSTNVGVASHEHGGSKRTDVFRVFGYLSQGSSFQEMVCWSEWLPKVGNVA